MEFLLIFVATWFVFILVAKLLPGKDLILMENINIVEIRKKYRKFELLSGLGFFIITPLLTYLLTRGMTLSQRIYLNIHSVGARFIFGVTASAFIVPAIFLAILLYGIILDFVGFFMSKYLFKNTEEFKIFYYDWNKRLAFGKNIDNKKLSLIITVIAIPLLLILFYLGVDNYTKLTDDSIIYNGYFSFTEKQYPYSNIEKIIFITKYKNAQSGKIVSTSPNYSVVMKDGEIWNTINLSINRLPQEIEIINFISQKSGVSVLEGVHNIDDKI